MDTYTIYIWHLLYARFGLLTNMSEKIVGVTSLRSEGFMLNTLMKWK